MKCGKFEFPAFFRPYGRIGPFPEINVHDKEKFHGDWTAQNSSHPNRQTGYVAADALLSSPTPRLLRLKYSSSLV